MVYARLAAAVGLALLWYAVWTVTVSLLVLAGTRYGVIPWCLATTTLLTAAAAIPLRRAVLAEYAAPVSGAGGPGHAARAFWLLPVLLSAALIKLPGAPLFLVGTAGVAAAAFFLAPAAPAAAQPVTARGLWLGLAGLIVLLLILYYGGSRPDGDDANFVNLAIGAQHTHGLVYQLDTMTGDGPAPLHLPTYRLQTFELLGAALSTITGLAPIAVLHLALPLPQLLLLAAVLALLLVPVAGRGWWGAAIATLGIAYWNSDAFATWGLHGVNRFFQGKGALVTILVPLACGLTARYLHRRDRCDLAALALVHVCAVGASANGLYVTPAASGFVALAALLADPRRTWRALLPLPLTLAWPALMAAIVMLRHLGLPSEVEAPTDPRWQFAFVYGYGPTAMLLVAPLPLLALTMPEGRWRRAAAFYAPAVLIATLNPLSWRLISAVTGNLGFRIFWAIPGPLIAGLVWTWLAAAFVPEKARVLTSAAAGLLILVAGIAWDAIEDEPGMAMQWGMPGLKVPPDDYRAAQELAGIEIPGCTTLAPEREATWLSTGIGRSPLVYARRLYLIHYRLTRPPLEMAVRWRLFRLVEGEPDPSPLPDLAALAAAHIRLGLIATDPANPNIQEINGYAASLNLIGPVATPSGLLVWRGACSAR